MVTVLPCRQLPRVLSAVAITVSVLTACGATTTGPSTSVPSAAAPSSVAPSASGGSALVSRDSLTAASNSTYAAAGYELGVGSPPGSNPPVCPYEVASWSKSLTGNGIAVSTSARGPANLTLSADTGTGGKLTRQATIDGHHAQSIISVDAPQESIQSLILTATDGGDGRGGSCTVAPAGGTMTGTDYCNQKKWPQQIPTNVVGLDWNDATSSFRELGCFNVGKSISTDGHDVGTDTIYTMRPTEIVSASPMVGTSVSLSTVVDLRVRPSS